MFFVVIYNTTAPRYTEFYSDFNRLMSHAVDYIHYTKPQYMDEIGARLLEKYFSSGGLDVDSHKNAVKVIYLFIQMFKKCTKKLIIKKIIFRSSLCIFL